MYLFFVFISRYSSHFVALSHFGVSTSPPHSSRHTPGIYQCLRYIIKHEGARGLFKGLGPNLVGVAPSRAIYFCAYSKSKVAFNAILPPDTPIVHVFSATCAGKREIENNDKYIYIKQTRLFNIYTRTIREQYFRQTRVEKMFDSCLSEILFYVLYKQVAFSVDNRVFIYRVCFSFLNSLLHARRHTHTDKRSIQKKKSDFYVWKYCASCCFLSANPITEATWYVHDEWKCSVRSSRVYLLWIYRSTDIALRFWRASRTLPMSITLRRYTQYMYLVA